MQAISIPAKCQNLNVPAMSPGEGLRLLLRVADELFEMIECSDQLSPYGHRRIDDLRTLRDLAAEPVEVPVG